MSQTDYTVELKQDEQGTHVVEGIDGVRYNYRILAAGEEVEIDESLQTSLLRLADDNVRKIYDRHKVAPLDFSFSTNIKSLINRN